MDVFSNTCEEERNCNSHINKKQRKLAVKLLISSL